MSSKFLNKMLYALTSAYSRKDYDNVQLLSLIHISEPTRPY